MSDMSFTTLKKIRLRKKQIRAGEFLLRRRKSGKT